MSDAIDSNVVEFHNRAATQAATLPVFAEVSADCRHGRMQAAIRATRRFHTDI